MQQFYKLYTAAGGLLSWHVQPMLAKFCVLWEFKPRTNCQVKRSANKKTLPGFLLKQQNMSIDCADIIMYLSLDICSGSNSLRSPGIDFEDITADAWDSRGGGEYFREVYCEFTHACHSSNTIYNFCS